MTRTRKPPKTLKRRGRELFRIVTGSFPLEAHHYPLLQTACEALDRYEQCRARLYREGLVYLDRFGKPKAHPLTTVERDARGQFILALRELGLDEGELPLPGKRR